MSRLRWLNLLLLFAMLVAIVPVAAQAPDESGDVELAPSVMASADSPVDLDTAAPRTSHRLIVELESPAGCLGSERPLAAVGCGAAERPGPRRSGVRDET